MAIVKTSLVDPLNSGRREGTRFYRVEGRTLARQIVKPIDGRQQLRVARRIPFAGGSKTFSDVLTPAEQAAWAAASPFAGNGQLEIIAASVSGSIAGIPQPTTRTVGTAPVPPNVPSIEYNNVTPRLLLAITLPQPGTTFQLIGKINPPEPQKRKPTRNELVVFVSQPTGTGLTNLITPYLNRFGGLPPTRDQIMMEFYVYDKLLPAAGFTQQIVKVVDTNTNAGQVRLATVPQPKLGSTILAVQPRFAGIAGGTPIPMTITAPDFTNTLPTTAPNFAQAAGLLTDTLGVNRTGSALVVLNAGSGRILSIEVTPIIAL